MDVDEKDPGLEGLERKTEACRELEPSNQEDPLLTSQVSMNAMTGTIDYRTMKIKGSVKDVNSPC
mgnify:CR=1 FL=1